MGFMLVDGNAISRAANYTKKLTTPDGKEVQAVYQTLQIVKRLVRHFPHLQPLFMWDGRAYFRHQAYSDYKGNRIRTAKDSEVLDTYIDQSKEIRKLLTLLGITQVIAPSFEADDLAGYFVRKAEDQEVLLVTGDQDWLQLVSKNVSWYDCRTNIEKFVDYKNFEEKTGYKTTSGFLEGKLIQGDPSDNIPGLLGLGEKAAKAIVRNFESFEDMAIKYDFEGMFKADSLPDDLKTFAKKINQHCAAWSQTSETLSRNRLLMDLTDDSRDAQISENIRVEMGKKDLEQFRDCCAELSFLTITRQLDVWDKISN